MTLILTLEDITQNGVSVPKHDIETWWNKARQNLLAKFNPFITGRPPYFSSYISDGYASLHIDAMGPTLSKAEEAVHFILESAVAQGFELKTPYYQPFFDLCRKSSLNTAEAATDQPSGTDAPPYKTLFLRVSAPSENTAAKRKISALQQAFENEIGADNVRFTDTSNNADHTSLTVEIKSGYTVPGDQTDQDIMDTLKTNMKTKADKLGINNCTITIDRAP